MLLMLSGIDFFFVVACLFLGNFILGSVSVFVDGGEGFNVIYVEMFKVVCMKVLLGVEVLMYVLY